MSSNQIQFFRDFINTPNRTQCTSFSVLPETEIQELHFEGDPLELLDCELSPYAVMELTFSTMVIVTIVLFVSMWLWL